MAAEKRDDDYRTTFWQDKADEARALAENMISQAGKQSMLAIANIYDGLAKKAERRAPKGKSKPANH